MRWQRMTAGWDATDPDKIKEKEKAKLDRKKKAKQDMEEARDEVNDANSVRKYYIADTTMEMGSNVMFYKEDGCVTVNIREAKEFSREEAIEKHDLQFTDMPYLVSVVNRKARNRVDSQDLPDKIIFDGDTKIDGRSMKGKKLYGIYNGKLHGTDVLFAHHMDDPEASPFKRTDEHTEAHSFGYKEVKDNYNNKSMKHYSFYRNIDIDSLVRLTLNVNDVKIKSMCRGIVVGKGDIGVRKTRGTCSKCGKIIWVFSSKDNIGVCNICEFTKYNQKKLQRRYKRR